MSTCSRVVVAGALACLLGIGSSSAASAASPAVVKSTNFAGYNGTATSTITTFSGGITVPTVTCPTTGSGSDFFAEVVIQDTSGSVGVLSVGGQCEPINGGKPTLSASISIDSNVSPTLSVQAGVGVAAGQTINASITEHTGTGTTSVAISNPTTKTSGSASTPLVPSFKDVQAGLTQNSFSGAGSFTPIPTFTSFNFNYLKFNGATLATLSPTESEMYNGSTLQVATTAIGPAGSFMTVFKHV